MHYFYFIFRNFKLHYHCMCFSRSSLTICKDTNIVTIKNRANEGLSVCKNLLCRTRMHIAHNQNMSQCKILVTRSKIHQPWVAEGPNTLLKLNDLHPFPYFAGGVKSNCSFFNVLHDTLEVQSSWSHPAINSNISFKILDLII